MSFLEKLQSADEGKKRRWMVLITLVVMVVVVFVWLSYFNSLIRNASGVQSEVPKSTGSEFSFWDTISGGAAAAFDSLKGLFSSPKEYIINP
ncbi:MAG: hypothetical protein Q7R86_00475 [bacterium]|nr:hypothetical protein [bacterium]